MTHYEERLEKDLSRIHDQLASLGQRVEESVKDAVHALLTGNHKLAYATILGDGPVNRASRELDRRCHAFIALHLPSAGHLRLISAILRANIALERIGDYAVTICRESVQLSRRPDGTVAREVELMADESRRMLSQAIAAFNDGNAEQAKATMGMADQVERTFDTVFSDLLEEGDHLKIKDLFAYLVVFNMLERISDQAKNVCEETVFAITGQLKAPKRYRILFLDEDNSALSQMAEAITRKNFPRGGEYSSAGRRAADAVDAGLASFLEERSIALGDARPKALDLAPTELGDYHIIVSLQGPVTSYVDAVPFHTTALEWDVGEAPARLEGEEARQRYEALYREVALQVQDLMTTLHGEEAP